MSKYLTGFGNEFASEDPRFPGSLPEGQNNPQNCPYGLFAEQISGTAYVTPRQTNRRSWLYRIRPSVQHSPYSKYPTKTTIDWSANHPNPSQGLNTFSGAGDPKTRHGMAIHIYCCNTSMKDKAMFNADGDFMIVPQQGALFILTEFGRLRVDPNEICVIQLGMKFQVHVSGPSRGYVLEVFDNHFILPDLGPIGANGLANPRDFKTPTAWFEDRKGSNFTIVNKYQGFFFQTILDSSIFTMLTCPAANSGKALVNVTVFRPRWSVADHTFRPPFYHRNCMSEFMGLISTEFKPGEKRFQPGGATFHGIMAPHGMDAETYEYNRTVELVPTRIEEGSLEKRFQPGGATFHGIMAPHGMDAETYEYNRTVELVPTRIEEGSLAFMIEGLLNMTVTKWAEHDCGKLDPDYYKEWQDIATNFNPNWEPPKEH
ncbi:homogentisate 1,2-dioxygenase [Ixodes scapularis]